jgi:hypothetical protein
MVSNRLSAIGETNILALAGAAHPSAWTTFDLMLFDAALGPCRSH